jgi:hypothetical protein
VNGVVAGGWRRLLAADGWWGGRTHTAVAYSQADCPYPTEFTTDGADPNDPSTLCVLTCPSTMFTSEDWDTANGLMITFSGSAPLFLSLLPH